MSNHLPALDPASNADPMLGSLPFLFARLYHGFLSLTALLRKGAKGLPSFRPGAGSVFFTLCAGEDLTVTDLAQRIRIPKPTLTGLLDGLERDGVIERSACPHDGRAWRVRLTRFGRSLERGLRRQHEQAVAIVQAGLTRTEAAELRRLMGVVLGNLDRHRADSKVRRSSFRSRARRA
jgi:DNA-binding MarR family transcriptional regulator